ncbi:MULTISPECIES: tyrosine-type recombinase/integrase [Cohnella]|nr:tyrosine-type recombinase/integrase [Cohnella fermenti]
MSNVPVLTFSEAARLFLQDCKLRNLTHSAYSSHLFSLRTFEKFLNENKLTFSELTPFDLSNRYMNYMLDRNLASATIRGRISTCKVFFKFLFRDGYLSANLAENFKLIKATNRAIFTFSAEQVEAILNQPDRKTFTGFRDYTMMLILLETGMRLMELSRMQVSDIDLAEGTIRIPSGKGRKPRIVFIQQTCQYQLLRYLQERGEHPFDDCWVTLKNTPLLHGAIKKLIIDHCKAAHIQGTRGSAHTFRHTMAKSYLLNGGDAFSLMHILGHTNIEMTKRYVDLFNQDLHDQLKKASPIESLFSKAETDLEVET